jgi:aspartyl-tRNA(Asn)/glutamyl-tRNA(Gln) amidotransferase subunit A
MSPTGMQYADDLARLPSGTRIGVPRRQIDHVDVDPEIRSAFDTALNALRDLGMEIIEVAVEGLADAAVADFVALSAETFAAHELALRTRMRDYGRSARLYQSQGAFLSAADYIAALRVGDVIRRRVDQALSSVDVLATPVVTVLTAEAARAAKAQPHTGGAAVFTAPFNLTGHPALWLQQRAHPYRAPARRASRRGVRAAGRRACVRAGDSVAHDASAA